MAKIDPSHDSEKLEREINEDAPDFGMLLDTIVEGYLKSEGYEFRDNEDMIEWVHLLEITLRNGKTEITLGANDCIYVEEIKLEIEGEANPRQ